MRRGIFGVPGIFALIAGVVGGLAGVSTYVISLPYKGMDCLEAPCHGYVQIARGTYEGSLVVTGLGGAALLAGIVLETVPPHRLRFAVAPTDGGAMALAQWTP